MSIYDETNFYPDESIGYLIRMCQQLGSSGLDQLFADEGLSHVQWSALILIHFRRDQTCAALARDLAHDKGAMTRMIDALEARGWVRRDRHADDRRLNLLALTPEGEAVAHRCRAKLIDCWNSWLVDWTPEEAASLVAHLQKLRRTLEANPACAG